MLEYYRNLIRYVKDRPGHYWCCTIDCSRIKRELGWRQSFDFNEGLRATVRWYLDNWTWGEQVKSSEYLRWMEQNYIHR